ncbi:Protein AF-9 [Araneus ventricosus]|uniref:Protein AF-9 n=1 Tax=Araneus ventricosus TaxID=182803 RepID=A0A4Y2MGT1_ARAVE|nr:Protein AF-9 [Araneus ventricosus]
MEVKIELGHKAWKNIKPTNEGYTHDWTVFVQGVNGNEIKHIVEKVVFRLPGSYPDPNRMKEKPPYVLSESTSEGLSIQIDVFFCTEAKLKKVNYVYDIFISDEVVNISWERKLTFPNPSKEFKEKLLLAGGELVDLLKTFPVMTGEFIKIKEEPVDEIQVVNNADEATLNTAVQKIDNLQNKCSTSKKIDLQKKLMAHHEEHFSRYEAKILNTNLGINQVKKKIEADEREITTLKLQLQMLQNKLLRIQNAPPDLLEKRTRGTKRKNEEDLYAINGRLLPITLHFQDILQNKSLAESLKLYDCQVANLFRQITSITTGY